MSHCDRIQPQAPFDSSQKERLLYLQRVPKRSQPSGHPLSLCEGRELPQGQQVALFGISLVVTGTCSRSNDSGHVFHSYRVLCARRHSKHFTCFHSTFTTTPFRDCPHHHPHLTGRKLRLEEGEKPTPDVAPLGSSGSTCAENTVLAPLSTMPPSPCFPSLRN